MSNRDKTKSVMNALMNQSSINPNLAKAFIVEGTSKLVAFHLAVAEPRLNVSGAEASLLFVFTGCFVFHNGQLTFDSCYLVESSSIPDIFSVRYWNCEGLLNSKKFSFLKNFPPVRNVSLEHLMCDSRNTSTETVKVFDAKLFGETFLDPCFLEGSQRGFSKLSARKFLGQG